MANKKVVEETIALKEETDVIDDAEISKMVDETGDLNDKLIHWVS